MGAPPDLNDDEHAAVVVALRKLIAADRFPYSPRLKPFNQEHGNGSSRVWAPPHET
jgi:hypothetical protein